MTYDRKRKLIKSLIQIGYILATISVIGLLSYALWFTSERDAARYEVMQIILNQCLDGSTEACRACATWSGDWGASCRDMLIREKFGR